MEGKLSAVAKSLKPSSIQELSFLAQRCNAINLAEGFPDFPAPLRIKHAAIQAITSDFNQYGHVHGICDHVANKMKDIHGLDVDPITDIVICCGQTEAFAATMLASDEVILFDPSFETYGTCVAMAGGVPVYVSLEPPCWTLNTDKLMKSFTSRTKAIVVNSPHNPTGKVFTQDELEIIAGACRTWDSLAVTDEECKDEPSSHLPCQKLLASLVSCDQDAQELHDCWRIGWAIAPSLIAAAIRNIHVKLTDSAPAPFQEAALTALTSPPEFFETLKNDYQEKRDFIVELLESVGFNFAFKPEGSFFLFAQLPNSCTLSDIKFVEKLIKKAEVVAVPGRGFFHQVQQKSQTQVCYQDRYIRFAYCKSNATLNAAAQKIKRLVDEEGRLTFLSEFSAV